MNKYAKAIVAAAIAGVTAVGTGLTDDVLTPAEWVAAAVAALGALGVVWRVPNAKQPPAVDQPDNRDW